MTCLTRSLAALVALTVLSPAMAFAVTPRVGQYVMHDHQTRGDGWHIELRVASGTRFLRQLVMHSERCNETVLTTRVRIRTGAVIASSKPFATIDGDEGQWRLDAQWVAPNQIMGTFHVTTPACDGGVRPFLGAARRTRTGRRRPRGPPPRGAYQFRNADRQLPRPARSRRRHAARVSKLCAGDAGGGRAAVPDLPSGRRGRLQALAAELAATAAVSSPTRPLRARPTAPGPAPPRVARLLVGTHRAAGAGRVHVPHADETRVAALRSPAAWLARPRGRQARARPS